MRTRQQYQTDSVKFSGAAQMDSVVDVERLLKVIRNMSAGSSPHSFEEQRIRHSRMTELGLAIASRRHHQALHASPDQLFFRTETGMAFLTEKEAEIYLKRGQIPDSALKLNDTYPESSKDIFIELLLAHKTNDAIAMQFVAKGRLQRNGTVHPARTSEPVFVLTNEHYQAYLPDTPAALEALPVEGDYYRAINIAHKRHPFGPNLRF